MQRLHLKCEVCRPAICECRFNSASSQPKRFSRAALLENFPRSLGLKIVAFFSAGATAQKLLARFFTQEMGFGTIVHMDNTDGIRVLFDSGGRCGP